jgi:hypothetical protein
MTPANAPFIQGVSLPTRPISAGPTLLPVFIRISNGYYHCDRLFPPAIDCETSPTRGVRRNAGTAPGGAMGWRLSVKQEYMRHIYKVTVSHCCCVFRRHLHHPQRAPHQDLKLIKIYYTNN